MYWNVTQNDFGNAGCFEVIPSNHILQPAMLLSLLGLPIKRYWPALTKSKATRGCMEKSMGLYVIIPFLFHFGKNWKLIALQLESHAGAWGT